MTPLSIGIEIVGGSPHLEGVISPYLYYYEKCRPLNYKYSVMELNLIPFEPLMRIV